MECAVVVIVPDIIHKVVCIDPAMQSMLFQELTTAKADGQLGINKGQPDFKNREAGQLIEFDKNAKGNVFKNSSAASLFLNRRESRVTSDNAVIELSGRWQTIAR